MNLVNFEKYNVRDVGDISWKQVPRALQPVNRRKCSFSQLLSSYLFKD